MGNPDLLQDKNQLISAEKSDGTTGVGPFQPRKRGFYLLDEAAVRKKEGKLHTLPEYFQTKHYEAGSRGSNSVEPKNRTIGSSGQDTAS